MTFLTECLPVIRIPEELRELRDTIKELNKLVATLNSTVSEMTAERDRYKEEAEYFKKKLFGTSSEKRRQTDIPGQLRDLLTHRDSKS